MTTVHERRLLGAAWAVSMIATLASLNLSGIPPLGWFGMGFIPCDLCWYQRILMYPLALVLGVAWWRSERSATVIGLALAATGTAVALFHSLVEIYPGLEPGQCSVVSCTVSPWSIAGLSVPNLSLIAFSAITALLMLGLRASRQTR